MKDDFATWLHDHGGTGGISLNDDASMSCCQEMLARIYQRQNAPVSMMWMSSCLGSRAATLTKLSGKPDMQAELGVQVAGVFAWAAAIATRCGIDLSDIMWRHFPDVCPYCASHPCTGHQGKRGDRLDITQHVALTENRPRYLTWWQVMIDGIYPENTLSASVSHLAQEAGEVENEVRIICTVPSRANDLSRLCLELADVVAHVLAVSTLMRVRLSELICSIYGKGCPVCRNPVCRCGHAFSMDSVGTRVLEILAAHEL